MFAKISRESMTWEGNYLHEILCDCFTPCLIQVTDHMDLVPGWLHPWVEAHEQSCIIQTFTPDAGFP